MNTFKTGDKATIINSNARPYLNEGDVVTIETVYTESAYVQQDKPFTRGDGNWSVSLKDMALVEPFKIGDLVVTTGSNAEWGYEAGASGKVLHIDSTEPKVDVEGVGYVYTKDVKLASHTHIKVLESDHPREYEVGDILAINTDLGPTSRGSMRVHNKHGNSSVVFANQWEYTPAPALPTAPEAPKRAFKVGDAVVVNANPEWAEEGLTGVVTEVTTASSDPLPYLVKWDDGSYDLYMREVDLSLVVAFTFEDIQKGDLIKAEYTNNGVKHTHEGIAGDFSYGDWFSAEGDFVANESWKATYTLLERPEPPKPNPFAEAKVGSIAYHTAGVLYLKTKENGWAPLTKEGKSLGYVNSDHLMRDAGNSEVSISYNA